MDWSLILNWVYNIAVAGVAATYLWLYKLDNRVHIMQAQMGTYPMPIDLEARLRVVEAHYDNIQKRLERIENKIDKMYDLEFKLADKV